MFGEGQYFHHLSRDKTRASSSSLAHTRSSQKVGPASPPGSGSGQVGGSQTGLGVFREAQVMDGNKTYTISMEVRIQVRFRLRVIGVIESGQSSVRGEVLPSSSESQYFSGK